MVSFQPSLVSSAEAERLSEAEALDLQTLRWKAVQAQAAQTLRSARCALLPTLQATAPNPSEGQFRTTEEYGIAADYLAILSRAAPFGRQIIQGNPVLNVVVTQQITYAARCILALSSAGPQPKKCTKGKPLVRGLAQKRLTSLSRSAQQPARRKLHSMFKEYTLVEETKARWRQVQAQVLDVVAFVPSYVPDTILALTSSSFVPSQAQDAVVLEEIVAAVAVVVVDESTTVPEASSPHRPRVKKVKNTEPTRRSARIARQNPRRSVRIAVKSARS
ncbi:hypothetical protein HKX48_006655 [Thoreauomyces humboldtii]|nr:hypothetical protein HKX48_006655 [Thoreauomyces humboldtii]